MSRPPLSPSATSSVQVVVRVRPLNDREKKHGTLPVISASTSDKTVTVIKGSGSRQIKSSYKFDNVFTSFSTQEDIFEATLQPIIRDVLNGYESTVFAYGQVRCILLHSPQRMNEPITKLSPRIVVLDIEIFFFNR